METFLKNIDTYGRQARIYPAFIVALPLVLALFVLIPSQWPLLNAVAGIAASFGVGYLLGNVARDSGKKKEQWLFESWGGKPTTQFLRHRGENSSALLGDVYRKLKQIFPELELPTQQQEENDPQSADDIYDVCTRRLLERTRDTEKFSLLFKENCSYGFRRNLWGMKSLGVISALVGVVAPASVLMLQLSPDVGTASVALLLVLNMLVLLGWFFVIKPSWVRVPADAYAERLFASLENLT